MQQRGDAALKKAQTDRRIQRTRQALHGALVELILEKGFEKVTVQDVIDRANIGRSTFYLHYRDMEDLLLGGFENLWVLLEHHLVGDAVPAASVWDLSLVVFQHAQRYTKVHKAVIGKQSGRLMFAHLHKYLSVLIRERLKHRWSKNTPVPLDFVVHHLTSSLISSLTWWLDHDMPCSPEQMNAMFRQLTQPAIDAMSD